MPGPWGETWMQNRICEHGKEMTEACAECRRDGYRKPVVEVKGEQHEGIQEAP